jgi:glycosyltransferase involved in cell wall biosynthesis
MKKIVLLIDTLIGGGAEKIVLNFARTFAKFEHQVHIILVKNIIEYDLDNNLYQVHYLSENGKLHSNKFINKYKLSQELRNKIKQIENSDNKQVDLIISNAEDMDLLGKKAKIDNFYIRYRNSMLVYYKSKFDKFSGFKRWRRKTKYKWLFKRVYDNQNIITVSKALVDDIKQVGVKPKTIQTIYNPFDFDYIQNKANEVDNNIPQEKYLIYVAKFENRKNQLLLIHAYHQANIDYPLVLMGDTHTKSDEDYLQQIKDLVKKLNLADKIIFPGFKQNPYPWIKNAELFVMSSNSEGLPLVLVEAMILGTKVISTNCPTGPSELLVGNLKEFLSPVGNAKKLAENITKALNNDPKIDKKILEKFRAKYSVNQYLKLCQ